LSADPTGAQPSGPAAGPAEGSGGGPSEEELRKAYEAELSRITTTDMMAQAAVSLLNLGARRLEAERDLEQVRDAIDGVRSLLGILERRIGQDLGPLRDALAQLQMAYAREVQAGATGGQSDGPASGQGPGEGGADEGGGAPPEGGSRGPGGSAGGDQGPPSGRRPGPAESSGRLWVPGG
jgi:hypothetical protein